MRWLILLGIVAVVAIGGLATAYVSFFEYDRDVSFRAVAADRARLFDGIESYVGVEAFLRSLDEKSLKYDVEYPEPSGRETDRPAFDMIVVKVSRYEHLGHRGRLLISFFNDRLMSVLFYPSDMSAYLEALRAREDVDLAGRSDFRVGRHARVWRAVDYTGQSYVGWEDMRLASERDLWIKRYS